MACKDGVLSVRWSKKENDVLFEWGAGCSSASASLLHSVFFHDRSPGADVDGLLKELERRGYDIKTVRFSIKKKVSHA